MESKAFNQSVHLVLDIQTNGDHMRGLSLKEQVEFALAQILPKLESHSGTFPVRDVNGNRIGQVEVVEEEEECPEDQDQDD